MFSRRSEDYRSATDLGLTQGTNRVSTATAIANFDRNIKALFARVRFVFRTKPEIEIRELDIIREIYKGCFRPATAEQIPMFLRKDDARKPWFIVTEEQIIDALRPLSRTATTSDIASHMEFFINIIIDSLTERTECFADKYTYAVGSMLTFLAELAAWAKNLKIDDLGNTQQEVQQRIQYLDAIMVQIVKNDLFKEPKTSYRMEILVDKLRKYLGETVLVRVQREISSQSSRDHFKNVRVYLTNFLVIASRWLCVLYCSKDFLETAKSLDISKLSRDGIESRFLNQFLQTDLGSLFQILGHIRALQLGDVPSAPGEVVASYSFYDGSDELRKDLVAKTEAVVAEVKQADHKGRVISGFHSCLYSEIDVLLPLLLKSLAMIETLSNYLLIFNNYFHITGIGGDIAAYLVLAEDLDVVLSKCTGLLSKIEKNILQVKDIFEKIFSKILRMPDVIYDDWKINYMEARVQFFELKKRLRIIRKNYQYNCLRDAAVFVTQKSCARRI